MAATYWILVQNHIAFNQVVGPFLRPVNLIGVSYSKRARLASMTICKYMTAEGGIRFLRSWQLRITPPSDFNDPFELRPPIEPLFSEEYVAKTFHDAAPEAAVEEMASQLTPTFARILSRDEVVTLARSLLVKPDDATQKRLLRTLQRKVPGFKPRAFLAWQADTQRRTPGLLQEARASAADVLPEVNAMIKRGLRERLPSMLGVLCMSRNLNQPLMWSHYADSHRGVVVEFDDKHPSFNRKRSDVDDFGWLRTVVYSKLRPKLNMEAIDSDVAFEILALTKSDHWAYEEEARLIWPLSSADETITTDAGPIHLLSFPASSVVSVTLGCKASDETVSSLRKLLRTNGAGHVHVMRARLDEVTFDLVYDPI
jgi:hypothetical protein